MSQANNTLNLFYDGVHKIGVTSEELNSAGLFNAVEAALSRLPQQPHVLEEYFIPGLYVRSVVLPAGSFLISNRHGTWHPFIITKGSGIVVEEIGNKQSKSYEYIANGEGEHFTSLTEPGVRRIILVVDETHWTTFHPTESKDPKEIMGRILLPNTNPLLIKNETPTLDL